MHAEKQSKRLPAEVAIPALLIALPAILFYGILFRHLVNLPVSDDYGILHFLNQLVLAKSTAAKFQWLLAAQGNEYKLFFVGVLSWMQLALLGHVNFVQLCVLGDSAVLVLALILWSTFLPDQKDLVRRLALFVPVAWLLFQMVYWETLNWALAGLQNLWVIVFSLGAIRCLLHSSRKAYAGALVLYALAIAASGNGLLVLPVGFLILITRRQIARASGLLAVSAVCITAYAYHYDIMSSQAPLGGSVFSELLHFRTGFSIAFVGNAGLMASEPVIAALRRLLPGFSIPFVANAGTNVGQACIRLAVCLALGTGLLALFGWLVWRGYIRRNPSVSSSVLFILLTALGVAGLRSGLGLAQSFTSRYTIYGTLLLIFAWTAVAEEFLQHRSKTLLRDRAYVAMTVAAIVLALCMDIAGTKSLVQRESEVARGMYAFEHPATPGAIEGPVLGHPPEDPIETAFHTFARQSLIESIRLGVYEPPRL
ncbi:MAG: hypothetical protein WCF30_09540 [Terracidiphilus sp.]